jgi:transaldolase
VYVDQLGGPDTVNTMPESTIEAVRDHGDAADRLTGKADEAKAALRRLADQGVDLDQITKELESEGIDKFVASFDEAVSSMADAKS